MSARRPSTVTMVILVVLIVAVGTTASVLVARRSAEKVGGSITAAGTAVGTFSFKVNDCASGAAFVPGFFGADLRGEGGYDLRVVDSGDGARLWLYPPAGGHGSIGISKHNCPQWDVFVDWAHITVNRVKTVSGHVHVSCEVGGGKVTANVDFQRCAL